MIRMITSDMDGTLLTGGKWDERRLPLDFEEVLGRLEQAGIQVLGRYAYPLRQGTDR